MRGPKPGAKKVVAEEPPVVVDEETPTPEAVAETEPEVAAPPAPEAVVEPEPEVTTSPAPEEA
jgi:hypothetical protein